MLSKILQILELIAKVLPAIVTDAEGTATAVKQKGGVISDIHAGLDGALKVLGDIAGAL